MVLGLELTLEHSFKANWMLRVAYVGNDGHRLYGTGDQESGLLQLNPDINGTVRAESQLWVGCFD